MEKITVEQMAHIVSCEWCIDTARDWYKYRGSIYPSSVSEGIGTCWLDHLREFVYDDDKDEQNLLEAWEKK